MSFEVSETETAADPEFHYVNGFENKTFLIHSREKNSKQILKITLKDK